MSLRNRVIWSDGLFLQPQHFQQQDRHFEHYVETRCTGLNAFGWGFTEIEIEREWLKVGKFGLRRAAGVFPDGTPFRMPDDEPLPAPLELKADVRDDTLYLAVPMRRPAETESTRTATDDGLTRYLAVEIAARNTTTNSADETSLEVGTLRTRILSGRELTGAYASIPLAHVVECRSDRAIVLEDAFMPTVLHVRASGRLASLLSELLGLTRQRGEALAGRVAATGRGSTAEIADYLMLQTINRFEPVIAHLADTGNVHPESFYELCVSMAGELTTFTTQAKRPPRFPSYRHENLRESFEPVMASLRESLNTVLTSNAVSIPLEPRKFGITVAIVNDRSLFASSAFIVAARADMPSEELRRRFPAQYKLGPAEKIADIVRLGLSGVPVSPLPVAPRQIPFHAGFAYFEVDQTHEMWNELKTSGGLAMFVTGDFPGITIEMWAIRSDRRG